MNTVVGRRTIARSFCATSRIPSPDDRFELQARLTINVCHCLTCPRCTSMIGSG